ncbi:MAG: hypothetical protein CL919_02875 [Deltaproteobacteria bacterium]|jgi:hypothetical protein|nr:hypothetical protein [Deltaproteobacteria bacterium]
MRWQAQAPRVSLFPFLSVLLSTMGVLAFLAISFVVTTQEDVQPPRPQPIEFQWVGAPGYVNPIFIRCYADRIEYYDLFRNRERVVRLGHLMQEIKRKNPELLRYFSEIAVENLRIKRRFGQTEHYPLLLVYPDGILAAEVLMALIEQVEGLNVGLEPMLPHWEVPYQSQMR